MTDNTIIITDLKLKALFNILTVNQRHKIYEQNLIPMWVSQCWNAWKSVNTDSEDSTRKFKEKIRIYAKKFPELEENEDLISFFTTNKHRILFISPSFDKLLAEEFNPEYKYIEENINKLMNKTNENNSQDLLDKYIKKYNLTDKQLPKWKMSDEEIQQFCSTCDEYPEMANHGKFIIHNALQWV